MKLRPKLAWQNSRQSLTDYSSFSPWTTIVKTMDNQQHIKVVYCLFQVWFIWTTSMPSRWEDPNESAPTLPNLLSVRKCNGKAGRLPNLCWLLDQNKLQEEEILLAERPQELKVYDMPIIFLILYWLPKIF